MRCTARAATSVGSTTRRTGRVARSSSRRFSRSLPRVAAERGVSTKPAAIKFTLTGASSSARLAVRAGSAAASIAAILRPMPDGAPSPCHEDECPAWANLASGAAPHLQRKQEMLIQGLLHLHEVQFSQRGVIRSPCGDHHVVNGRRQAAQEGLELLDPGGIKRRRGQCPKFGRRPLQAPGITAREDDPRPLVNRPPSRFEPYARTTPDHHNGLPYEFRETRCAV